MDMKPLKHVELDARAVVPVVDEVGGVVMYIAGRPAYYVLNGEWFEAVPATTSAAVKPNRKLSPLVPAGS